MSNSNGIKTDFVLESFIKALDLKAEAVEINKDYGFIMESYIQIPSEHKQLIASLCEAFALTPRIFEVPGKGNPIKQTTVNYKGLTLILLEPLGGRL